MTEVEQAVGEIGENGLPLLTPEQESKGGSPLSTVGWYLAARAAGLVLSWPIFHFADGAKRSANLVKVEDYGFLYLSAYCFSLLVGWLNMYPMIHKGRLQIKGNIRANMQFYKVLPGPGQPRAFPLIGLEEDGAVGQYNRSNRSLAHFIENSGVFLVSVFPAGIILPLQTFILTIVYCLARIVHQIGYVSGYGSHEVGFALFLCSNGMIEGIVFWSAMNVLL